MSRCYPRFGFSGTKLFSSLLTLSLSELCYNLSTSQTCNFSVALVPTLLLPLHLGSPTWFFYFLFLVLNPSFSLSQSKLMKCLSPLYFPSVPLLKSCLNSPAEANFSCYSDHVNFHFLEALPGFSLLAEVT